MFIKISKALCLISLAILVMISTSTAFAEKNIFNELSQNELSELSAFYQNSSNAPGFDIYNQSKDLNLKYPFYSYELALKCSKAIQQENANDLANVKGVNATIDNLTKIVEDGLNEHREELFRLRQQSKSFASEEWLSLAQRDMNESKTFFDASRKSYSDGNYNTTLIYLTKSNFALYTTGKLLKIAKNRNGTSPKYKPQSTKEREKIASNWMKDANNKISLLAVSEKRKDILKLANGAFNDSKRQYSNENYYLSLMSAAEAYALAEFGLDYEKYASSTEVMIKSEGQVEAANNSLAEIYEKSDADIPLAELHLEMAKLRLEDAKNTKEINIIPLSDMAIGEALIAEKQIKAVMDLNNTIEDSAPGSVSMQIPSGAIPILGAAIAVYLMLKKKYRNI